MPKKEIKGARFILRKSNNADVVPTIPNTNDHTKGNWKYTDIYEGEIFINTHDNKMWFRNDTNELVELATINPKNNKINNNIIPDSIWKLNYLGIWYGGELNKTPSKGDYYIIGEYIEKYIDGITTWNIGDYIIYDGLNWQKIDYTKRELYSENIKYNNKEYQHIDNIKNAIDYLLVKNYFNNSIKIGDDFEINNNIDKGLKPTINNHKPNNAKVINYKSDIKNKSSLIIENNNEELIYIDNENFEWKGNKILHNKNINDYISFNNVDNELISKTILSNGGYIYMKNKSNYIIGDGMGIRFYYSNKEKLSISSKDYTTSHNILCYNNDKEFNNDLDIINKKYVDNKIDKTKNIIIDTDNSQTNINIDSDIKNINIIVNENINEALSLFLIHNQSKMITICFDIKNDININVNMNDSIKLENINNQYIVGIYYNESNKKWYKAFENQN